VYLIGNEKDNSYFHLSKRAQPKERRERRENQNNRARPS